MPQTPNTAEVLEQVIEGERAVKDELHRQIIVEKLIPVKALATAAGYSESSTYKALDRDAVNGLSFRLLDAAALCSPSIGSGLLRLLSRRWEPASAEPLAPLSLPETLRELAEAAVASARAQAEAYGRLADGDVSAEDMTALERAWAVQDEVEEQARQAVRAMCSDRADFLARPRMFKAVPR